MVVQTSAKWVISRRKEDENAGEMNKTKNAHARRAKLQILNAYICKLMTTFSIAVVVAWALFSSTHFF